MQQRTKELAQLVADNRQEINKAYKLAEADKLASTALTWALAGRRADAQTLKDIRAYLKSESGIFSAERGGNEEALVTYMGLSDDAAAYLAKVRAIFAKVMEGKKLASETRFGEALIIANNTSAEDEAIRVAERTEELFERMRDAHPWITNDRDRTFAALMALSDRDADQILADAEECYQLLGEGFKLTEGRQTMANVLSLSPVAPAEKVAKLRELREAFKANKISIGWASSQEFAVLALLAADERPAAEIAADVAEVAAFLKKQKGFGTFAITGATRVIVASVVSTYAYAEQHEADSLAAALSLAIAQAIMDWIIMMVVIWA